MTGPSTPPSDDGRRDEMHHALRRDLRRHQRRDRSPQSFWRSLGVLGMVGWPIALATVGGAWLGRLLDQHWHTGVRFTLMLLTLGVMMGSYTAWRTLKERS